ncbi:PREDICTED: probable ATP-dependent DNA helicase HFM1 isoform X2 [Crocodylus porosus]|uniref:probable ATP-dependent DNA helicase HFM1 isoform X2 n=1 Tax=Crocodylus porosus TaxID=8502 RepID=UPI00093A16D3|nr:PREDICTED: probable ATP-dependent DNA helicase HFM1 isoform X2 [Crocodylus porosus]
MQVLQYSDFNLHSVNDVFSACENEKGVKVQSFLHGSETSDVEGAVVKKMEVLRAVTEVPPPFRNIFKDFPYFNYIQSKALDDLLYTDRNFVICAPTGSGKTVMFELAITRLLMEVPMPWLNIKIVYMAPIKALCSQRFDDWKEKFGPIGLSCKELTGDTVVDDLFEIQHAHIIMTTPEKWDSMTRKWRDNSLVQLVRLFLIDEVHVVKDESRGATLEVVVSRMKTVQSSVSRSSENPNTFPSMRFVAVSATIPNAEDIAEWLTDGKKPAVCLKIDENHRPVKLRKVVLGFPCSGNQTEFKFDLTLNYKIASVIQTYSEQKPALVFCATRKGVQQAASVFAKDAKFIMTTEQKQRLQRSANSIKDSKLRDLLIYGVAYHHAGMELSDRKIIEGAFTVGDLPVLCFSPGLDRVGIEAKLQDLSLKNVNDLASHDLIKMDEKLNFRPTENGKLMAWYYIAFDTVKQFSTIKGTETLSELVTKISSCTEFSDIKLRTSEKKILNALNKDKNRITIRFPMEGKIKTTEMKVNCLIQAQLGCIPIQDFTLTQDIGKIFRTGIRVTKWLSDFLASQRNSFSALLNSLILAKCFRCKLWENSLHVSKQLEKIGMMLSNAMVNSGLTSFKKIEDTNARELELILNRHPPFGNQIKESVIHLPKYALDIEQVSKYSDTVAEILVTIVLTNFKQLQTRRTAPDFHYVTLIIGNADNEVVFKQKIMDLALLKTGNWTKKIEVKRALRSEELSINVISSDYVGLDIQQNYTAFYFRTKRFGNQVVVHRKSDAKSSLDVYHTSSIKASSARIDTGSTCNQEVSYTRSGNRECNHHCKNKDACGHDCCKIGVSQKSELKRDSKFSSYLSDLRNRSSISSVPPVKRLKMQLLNQTQNVDLKQFVYTPKSLLPALPRSEYVESPASSVDQCENVDNLGRFEKQVQQESYEKINLSWKHSSNVGEKTHQAMMSNKNLESSMPNLTDADRSSSWFSKALNVNFELGDEVWDDFDDEKLIYACSFSSDVANKDLGSGSSCLQNTTQHKPLFQNTQYEVISDTSGNVDKLQDKMGVHPQNSLSPTLNAPSKMKLPTQNKNTNEFSFQAKKHPNPSEVKKTFCSSNSGTVSESSKSSEKGDFFICNKERKSEIDLRYLPDDEANDAKPFLGIFDGIF